MPKFVEPQFAKSGGAGRRAGKGVGARDQVRRLSHADARRRPARRTLFTRKGLDWSARSFPALIKAGTRAKLPDGHHTTARWWPSNDGRFSRISPACKPRCRTRRPTGARSSSLFDLSAYADGKRYPAGLPLCATARTRLQAILAQMRPTSGCASSITSSSGGDAVLKFRLLAWIWRASSPNRLDAPYRSGRYRKLASRPSAAAGHEVVIGGWVSHGRVEAVPFPDRRGEQATGKLDPRRPRRHGLLRQDKVSDACSPETEARWRSTRLALLRSPGQQPLAARRG